MLFKLKAKLLFVITGCLLVSLFVGKANAQEVPKLAEHQKSVALMDLRIDKLLESAKEFGGSEAIENIPMDGPFRGIKPTDLKRVFGAASLPENMEKIGGLMMGPPADAPLEFFVRLEFTNAEAVEKLQAGLAVQGKKVTYNGKEYMEAPEGPWLLAHRVNETTFEFGTKSYCLQPKRNFFTKRLTTAFKSAPNDPVRIVIDLETRAALISQLVAMGKEQSQGEPLVSAYLDLVDNAKSIVFTQGMGEKLATLMIEGVDESLAEEVKEGLASALGTAKIAGGSMLGPMAQQMGLSEKSTAVAKGMIEKLEATRSGTTVSVVIEKPEGFKETLVEFQKLAAAQAKKTQRLNNFRQMGLAALNFESAYRKFPYQDNKDFHDDLSWRFKILPFIEENQLYDQLKPEMGPTEKPNVDFTKKMPKVFGSDGQNSNVSWIQSSVTTFGNITDGSSNTIMLIENPNAGPWITNNPLSIDDAVKLVSNLKDGEDLVVVFYDCSTRLITNKVDKENLRNLFDPTDGNTVNTRF